ncbi:hypothetical protein GOP47_0000055 [Adiantum capillus-veneris]|uniref:Uncharacterized protein n=1 Tax=Adiantum capillus-veneris TaxID=13818 RepID=A0A9D4VDZ6_ADICA|nr:hypothetical protein GOP47_0000055 [Adiantum capillus-veneris]
MADVPLLPRPAGGSFVASRPLLFALNGHRVEIPSPDPSMTLLSFLRSHTQLTGTKLSCGEGGCGACLVLLSTYDPKSKQVQEFSINSCLALLCSLDGCSITTIEGIGSTRTGLHAVQQRIAGFHGSHCGFCTPGMCISIYSCLRNAHISPSDIANGDHQCSENSVPNGTHSHVDSDLHEQPVHTIPTLACEDAQKAIVGNICRCTGYRPIVDSCKSFAGDVDIEDLGINTFWASNKDANVNLLPTYVRATDSAFPKFLMEELELKEHLASRQDCNHTTENLQTTTLALPLHVKSKDASVIEEERLWIQGRSLEEVFQAWHCHRGRGDVKLVVGNTSAGYYKGENPRVFIDISRVPELLTLQEVSGTLKVGSAVTIEELILTLESILRSNHKSNESLIRGLISHLRKLANPHVRRRASVGGNLIMAQQFSFDSDLATLLLALGSLLHLVDAGKNRRTLSMEEFLQKGSLESGWLLEFIDIPLWLKEMGDAACHTNGSIREVFLVGSQSDCITKWQFDSYRAAPRSLGNSLAYINAAFLTKVLNTGSCYQIMDVRLAFGAFGQGHAIRAHKVEGFLQGRPVHESVLLEAITILKNELMPFVKGTKLADYKSSVAVSFLFDFFAYYLQSRVPSELGLATECERGGNGPSSRNQNGKTDQPCLGENSIHKKSPFTITGRQNVPGYEDDIALGKAAEKSEAKLQASGEAIYVDDIPAPEHCLYAAFVTSVKAFAKVKMIDTKLAVTSPGAVAFISASDIPKGGANVGALHNIFSQPENLFATDCVEYVGHPLGVMVADSPEHAKQAAAKVRVEYEVESSPILSVEEAEANNSFFPKSFFPFRFSVGDIETGFLEADHKITDGEVRSGSQYFFYMETQTALAVPDEDKSLVVYSSCQSPSVVQESISACLGIPHHNVRVITRRVGGAFGGKAFRNVGVASACAIAAHKLRHPVRMYLDRKTDMVMMGGRHPVRALYSVSFKQYGKVTGLRAKISIDGGWSQDFTSVLHLAVYQGLLKYNWVSLDIEFLPCKTNLSCKSAMRAPGHVQGSFIADTILEHIASVLGLDMKLVVSRNLHTIDSARLFHPDLNIACKDDFDVLPIWNTMVKRVEAKERDIDSFNMSNHWLKRGLSVLPCVYKVHRSSTPARVSIFKDGSVVVEVGGIEIGQGLWTKVKQATINGLSPLCERSKEGLESLNIRVVQADSMSLPHGGLTSSSTTSEGSCEAVMKACQLLVDRLMPVKLQKQKVVAGNLSWIDLITLSKASKVDLSAQVHWFPEQSTFAYLTYSVAATMVEVNTLTGAVTILESDLIYDCGKSLNPAIDIGQIEGSFVQGIGFFLTEQHEVDVNGVLLTNGTWTYKPPTVDNIPRKFHVEMISGAARQNRVLSSKACGEPPLLLAGTVHSAVRQAIQAARKDCFTTFGEEGQGKDGFFRLDTPASMERVKNLCGLERVEGYLKHHIGLQESHVA